MLEVPVNKKFFSDLPPNTTEFIYKKKQLTGFDIYDKSLKWRYFRTDFRNSNWMQVQKHFNIVFIHSTELFNKIFRRVAYPCGCSCFMWNMQSGSETTKHALRKKHIDSSSVIAKWNTEKFKIMIFQRLRL